MNGWSEPDQMIAAMNHLLASTVTRKAADAAAAKGRAEQLQAICSAFAAGVPMNMVRKITGLTRSRIDQIRRSSVDLEPDER